MTLFAILSLVTMAALSQTSGIWQRASARDEAEREIMRAVQSLQRDLTNGSGRSTQVGTAQVPASLNAGLDGDALSFLTVDDGSGTWQLDSLGAAGMKRQITYYLSVPQNVDAQSGFTCVGKADGAGYEDQCPFKSLVRLEKPLTGASFGNSDAVIDPTWPTTLVRPGPGLIPPNRVVAINLLQFRILQPAPNWQFSISATAVGDARRTLAIGQTPLSATRFTLNYQLTIRSRN